MDNTKINAIEEVNERKKAFQLENNIKTKALLLEATNLCLKGNLKNLKDFEDKDTNEKIEINLTQTKNKLGHSDYQMLLLIFRTITSEVCRLSPEQLDSLWCNDLLATMQLNRITTRILNNASDESFMTCLFDKKKIILREVFPEYFEATYGNTYDIGDVLNASGETLKNINHFSVGQTSLEKDAGDGEEKKRSRNTNKGTRAYLVDKLILKALENFFSIQNVVTTEEKLQVLADAKAYGLKTLGLYKILKNRNVYNDSYLDFYYMKGIKPEDHLRYAKLYLSLRNNSQKERDSVTEFMEKIVKAADNDSLEL